MPSAVEAMIDAFLEAGTSFIAGVPGEESLEMIEAARQRGLRFILSKQETAGAIMAATAGELTGAPGVCLSTRAPGAANMVLGVTHAWMDRCPLVAITDQFAGPVYGMALRQRLNQMALYAPITKWQTSIRAESVRQQSRRAIRTAISGIPGPVQVDLPADERLRDAGPSADAGPLLPSRVSVIPDRAGMMEPLHILDAARRPVLMVGTGVFRSGASAELVALAERLGAPVITTPKTKGAIAEDHPLSAGCFFGGMTERKLIDQADLIVTVGLDTVEMQPVPWPYATNVLALGSVQDIDGPVPASVEVIGDLKAILAGLALWARDGSQWGERAAREFRRSLGQAVDVRSAGLAPQRVIDIARSVLPRDTIATCDVGASRLFSVTNWPVYAPRDYLCSNGIATMGYSVPAALGARMVHPGRPIVALTGDGSFLMAIAELQTSVAERLPITILVQDNGGLGVMSLRQDMRNIPRTGTVIGGVDWEHLAKTFGADAAVVDSENGLGDALGIALNSGRTTIVAAHMDPAGYGEQYWAMLSAQRPT